jgi:uncharacterized membrane protein YphA (DoxX/SURF4 family)
MDVVLLLGRVLFGLIFINAGRVHFSQAGVDYARAYNAPRPEILVPLSGAAAVAGGVSVALGLWADIGALLIIGFLAGITPIMHAFWKETDPQQEQLQAAMFFKNLAMLGGAIVIFWAYNQGQDLPASLSDALLGAW